MSGPIRIALVTPGYPPRLGGVERHVEMLATGAARAGFDVEVLTTDPTGRLPAVDRGGGVMVRRFSTLRGSDVFYLSPRLGWWLIRHAREFDLIHAHSYHAPLALFAAIAAKIHGVPFIVTPHYHGTGHTQARRLIHSVYRAFGAWMVRRAALVICNSEAECNLVRSDFGATRPTAVILPGVDLQDLVDALPFEDAGKVVLTGGRLEAYKQVDRVVQAMTHLPVEYRLVIFGEGPARPSIEAVVQEHGLVERVAMLGRVSGADLARWFRTATVFVSLSRKEAFGLTVLEAAAAGSAVVCSDIPAYREMAERLAGYPVALVPLDARAPDIAAAIDSAATSQWPSAGDLPALPTWDAMVDQITAAYRRALRTGSHTDAALRSGT